MKKLLFSLISSFSMIYTIPLTNAQGTVIPNDKGPLATCIQNGSCGLKDIPIMIQYMANYLVGIVGTISVVMLMIGGYQTMASGFSETEKGKGKKTIAFALGGLAITLLAWVIVNVVQVTVSN